MNKIAGPQRLENASKNALSRKMRMKRDPPVEFLNPPKGKYEDVIIHGDNLAVLDEMAFDGVNNVVAAIFSPR